MLLQYLYINALSNNDTKVKVHFNKIILLCVYQFVYFQVFQVLRIIVKTEIMLRQLKTLTEV